MWKPAEDVSAALAGGLHTTPPPKERAGTRVAGQECPTSAHGAPGASSCSPPRALHCLHLDHTPGIFLPFQRDPHPGDEPWAGTVPSSAPSMCSSLLPAVCPLIHEHRWQWHHLLSKGQTETSVEKTDFIANTNINLFSPPQSQIVLLQGTLAVSISIDSFSAYINPKFPTLFFFFACCNHSYSLEWVTI